MFFFKFCMNIHSNLFKGINSELIKPNAKYILDCEPN